MKRSFAIAMAAALVAVASPTLSQDQIVVGATPTQENWVQSVGTGLNAALEADNILSVRPFRDGIVSIRFQANYDGRPTNIRMIEKSGDVWLDRAASNAVESLSSLRPLPVTMPEGQVFQANIIGANSQGSYERLLKRLERNEARRRIASTSEAKVVALNLSLRSDG